MTQLPTHLDLRHDEHRRVMFPVSKINDSGRYRKDMGDLDGLADSIRTLGLIHPICINTKGILIAGGRRLAAMRDILKMTEVPITYFEFADEATLRILELEENIRRKQTTWQEEVLAIADVHSRHSINAALDSKKWTQKLTGELLNQSEAHISYALQLADLIRSGDKDILSAARMWDAINLLVKRRADESNKLVAKLTIPKGDPTAQAHALLANDLGHGDDIFSTAPTAPASGPAIGGVSGSLSDDGEMPAAPANDSVVIPLSRMLLHGDALKLLAQFPDASVDHVITDWPYGIDMDNIQQSGGGLNVDSTRAEHDVSSNEALHAAIVPLIFRVLKPGGFFITWTDFAQWQRGLDLVESVGFKAQRWPLTWVKTSHCQNMSALVNFTKTTEIAMVCRKGNANLVNPQPTSHWIGGNDAEAQLLGHPFAKPFKLWEWLYSAVCLRGQTVLDPFAGRGSSTIAALQYGLSPVAIECNEEHHAGLVVNVSEWYKRSLKNVQFT